MISMIYQVAYKCDRPSAEKLDASVREISNF